jgi:nucleotide-binding universal stress UspA family protein
MMSATGSHEQKKPGEVMFEKILFPTDFSEEAKTELSCISSIPGIKEIILFHVIRIHPVPMGTEMVEGLVVQNAKLYLEKAEAYIAILNPDIRVTLEEKTADDITGAILEKAEELRADLIVIHASIKGTMTGVLFSHVSSKVLCRISRINVMITPHTLIESLTGLKYEKFCPMIFSRILCPTDFSDLSLKATALAGTMHGVGEIILLHVVETGESVHFPEEKVKASEIRINVLCDQLTAQGIKARIIVLAGKPEIEIPRIAREEDVSLIWMGSTAHGCLHDFFFGSTVHDVIMNAARPVIVIRSAQ